MKQHLRRGDAIVIGAVLLTAAVLFAVMIGLQPQNTADRFCEVSQNNQVIDRIPLGAGVAELRTVVGQYENTLEVRGDQVRFSHSNCPNQVCVQTGWISRPYQTAACLPNRVLVRIVATEGEADPLDGVTLQGES